MKNNRSSKRFFGSWSDRVRPQHRLHQRLRIRDSENLLTEISQLPTNAAILRPYSLPFDFGGIGRREAVPLQQVGGFPYLSICRIWSDTVQGTGFLVSGNRILTAAHVIAGANTRNVQFPGQQAFRVTKPQMGIHPNYRAEGDAFDYGALSVHPQLLAGIPALPMVAATPDVLRRSICEIAGYAAEFEPMVRYPKHGQNRVDPRTEIRLANGMVLHRFDTSQGQSGAPILARPTQNPAQCVVIGLHTFGEGDRVAGWLNRGVAFPANVSLA